MGWFRAIWLDTRQKLKSKNHFFPKYHFFHFLLSCAGISIIYLFFQFSENLLTEDLSVKNWYIIIISQKYIPIFGNIGKPSVNLAKPDVTFLGNTPHQVGPSASRSRIFNFFGLGPSGSRIKTKLQVLRRLNFISVTDSDNDYNVLVK